MGIVLAFPIPFYEGGAVTEAAPYLYPAALDGRGYLIDLKSNEFAIQTIEVTRQQADNSRRPGETSLNPAGLWRRTQKSWHLGAGQSFADREDENSPFRFHTSKNMDVWDRWEMKPLHGTQKSFNSAATNLKVVVVGDYLYYMNGTELYFTNDILTTPTSTSTDVNTVANEATGTLIDFTSDGYNVWTLTAHGVHHTTRGATATTHLVDYPVGPTPDNIAYVKSRLFATADNIIYTIDGTPSVDEYFTHANPDFKWVGFAEHPAAIFTAGYSGDKSVVYKIAIKTDATALDPPVVAGELPDGEVVTAIYGYLGFIFLGTSLGVRYCEVSDGGNLSIGALIPTPLPVRAFEGQDRFVWFGWSDFDEDSTGLGRLDLSVSSAPASITQPAFASDLMFTGGGEVYSIATFQNRRVFAVQGEGIIVETDDYTEAYLETGQITYDIAETKIIPYLRVHTAQPLKGSYSVEMSLDEGPWVGIGTREEDGIDTPLFETGQAEAEMVNFRITLTPSPTDPDTTYPVIRSLTAEASPIVSTGYIIIIPFIFAPRVLADEVERFPSHVEQFAHIASLRETRKLTTFTMAERQFIVTVEDFNYKLTHQARPEEGEDPGFFGTCLVRLKTLAPG